jgi:hypothetical protein
MLLLISLPAVACAPDDLGPETSASVAGVANGTSEDDANFPWVVRVHSGLNCHGVLIAPTWVLTAAHCGISGPLPSVTYTRTNPNTGAVTSGTRLAAARIVHEGWGSGSYNNDIALIRLSSPFPPDPLLQPAELPLAPGFVNQVGVIASKIEHTTGPLPSGKVSAYRAPITAVGEHYFVVRSPSSALCSGDSGSGYTLYGGGKHFILGIASHVDGNGSCDPPTAENAYLTNVFTYNDWIREKTGLPKPFFNSRADILWRENTGALAIWLMDGAQRVRDLYPSYYGSGQPVGNDWKVVGAADFFGDGKADLLWRHLGGTLAIWKMVNGFMVADTYPSYYSSGGVVGNDWQIQGIGRFDSDGASDILWKHNSGALAIWTIRNGQFYADKYPGSRSTDWQVRGVGDFDGDGFSDILWRNASGALDIWFTRDEGSSYVSRSPGAPGLEWQVAGIANFNADSRSDILWRNSNGALAVWLMTGALHADEYPGTPPLEWKIEQLGDFNGDRSADILWRHTSGTLATWFMFGGLNYAQGYPGVVNNAQWNVTDVARFD